MSKKKTGKALLILGVHFYMRSVFDFYDWCNTLPQTQRRKQRSLLTYSPVGHQSEIRENGLTVLESTCQPGCISSGGSREESAFLPFPAFQYCSYSLALALLYLQSQQWWAVFLMSRQFNLVFYNKSPSSSLFCLPLPLLGTLVIISGLPGQSRITFPFYDPLITFATSFLPCK